MSRNAATLRALLALAITLVVAVTASAEPIRETKDDGDIIGFSSDPEEGNTVYRNEDLVEAHRHLAKRTPFPPFDPITKTKKKFKKFKKFVVKPKKLKKLIKLKPKLKKAKKLKKKLGKKLLPFAIPFGAGVGLGGAGGFGASQLAPLLAGLGGGGGAALPFLAPPAMLATLAVQQQG